MSLSQSATCQTIIQANQEALHYLARIGKTKTYVVVAPKESKVVQILFNNDKTLYRSVRGFKPTTMSIRSAKKLCDRFTAFDSATTGTVWEVMSARAFAKLKKPELQKIIDQLKCI